MKTRILQTLVLAFCVFSISACQSNSSSSTTTTATLKPGESTRPLAELYLAVESNSDSYECDDGPCEPLEIDMCWWARNATSIAIVEPIERTELFQGDPDPCAGRYRTGAHLEKVRVVALAAGEELPSEMTVVFLGSFFGEWSLSTDSLVMIGLRFVDGEWFAMNEGLVHTSVSLRQACSIPTIFRT